MTAFQTRIQAALADPVLQSALDNNAERRANARDAAFASLPEGREPLRRQAHAMRQYVVAHLDALLDQFMANVQRNGIIVHRAADGIEAVRIVLDIAQQHHVRRAAKAKSMVSEEIHLNAALQQAGIEVVETDLGEYIIQLRGEPPAHIITPAVHLTRAQVGQTFAEKLGIPLTDDIPTLTTTARKVLRQTFLDAGMGLSGVNAGVAETGTLTLVTNEGNGRMCTTLPPVHVALMGMERLVPSLDDLSILLRLLPRSATGQKLSVYTSLIHAPRRPDEIDGPQERHLIIVDNGRSRLQASPLSDALMCIRCGACLNACPVFRELGGHAYRGASDQISPYPGPIGSVISPALFGVAAFGHLARASSLCGACKDACPVDIDLPRLLLEIRAMGAEPGESGFQALPGNPAEAGRPDSHPSLVPWGLRLFLALFTWVARSPWRFRTAQKAAGLFSRVVGRSGFLRLPAFTGWGLSRDFPSFSPTPFTTRFGPTSSQGTDRPASPIVQSVPALDPNLLHPLDARPSALQTFTTELSALGGQAIACTAASLPAAVAACLREHNVSRLQAWAEDCLPPGLLEALHQDGFETLLAPDPELPAGLTGALLGIADTGSVVVTSGAGRPLTASLLPPVHLCVLRQSDLLPDLPAALRHPALRRSSAAALITGPSRTADIEMTLTIGVHGPGTIIVFIVQDL
jgi:L-lactate dehydrogenase complex protein LldF